MRKDNESMRTENDLRKTEYESIVKKYESMRTENDLRKTEYESMRTDNESMRKDIKLLKEAVAPLSLRLRLEHFVIKTYMKYKADGTKTNFFPIEKGKLKYSPILDNIFHFNSKYNYIDEVSQLIFISFTNDFRDEQEIVLKALKKKGPKTDNKKRAFIAKHLLAFKTMYSKFSDDGLHLSTEEEKMKTTLESVPVITDSTYFSNIEDIQKDLLHELGIL